MRRLVVLALTLLVAASAAALTGQGAASAQPVAIQVVATGPSTYQVSVNFNSDEIPVSFSVASPASGPAAAVTSLTLVSCSQYYYGNCTGGVPDTDPSATAYNSGPAIGNLDPANSHEAIVFVVEVTVSCTGNASAVIVASQGGLTVSAPVFCGAVFVPAPYFNDPCLYGANYGYPYGTAYPLLPAYPVRQPFGQPHIAQLEWGGYFYYPFTCDIYGIYRRPNLGKALAPIVFGAGGSDRNLARAAIQQVLQQLPGYLAAAGVDQATAQSILNTVTAYANAYMANPGQISPQLIMAQVQATIASYAGPARGTLVPPNTGEAGWVELFGDLEYPVLTFYGEVPVEDAAEE